MADKAPKTRKLNLDRTYVYGGVFYGPGPTEVPDGEIADSLEAKQKTLQSKGIAPTPVSDAIKQEAPSIEQLPGGQQNPGAGDTTLASNAGKPGPGAEAISQKQADERRANAPDANAGNTGEEGAEGTDSTQVDPANADKSAKGTEVTADTTTPGRTVTKVPAAKK